MAREAVGDAVRVPWLERVMEGEGVEEGLTVLVALALTTTPPPLRVFRVGATAKVPPLSPAPSTTTLSDKFKT